MTRREHLTTPDALGRPAKRTSAERLSRALRVLGPGLVTGAADDDPSGIATHSQSGAQLGFGVLWTVVFTLPLMVAVQEACMRIGAVTGRGLAAVVRETYPRAVLYPVVLLVVVANTLNVGSDIGAMSASLQLLVPGVPAPLFSIAFALVIVALEVFVSYRIYIRVLKWLALALFAYVITAFLVTVPWDQAVLATVVPHIEFTPDFLFLLTAILGTTISPYLFFWQTSNVVEDEIAEKRMPDPVGGVPSRPRISRGYLRRLRVDTVIGMFFANLIAWFIMLVGAVVLHDSGITTITTAADAAAALRPLVNSFPNAGVLAEAIFAIGVVGVGLMSVPVLAGSSAYAVSETFGWREGLSRRFGQARAFYLTIVVGTLVGMSFNFLGVDPIQALVVTAVVNGIVAVPLIFLILRLSSRADVMGEHRSRFWSKTGLWLTFILMAAAAVALLVSLVIG
ncbi:NRAMP family divalent metal transporter [Lysinimonas soli]|uniref:NRAMP family divalent metal transporter n=1 Tax=Lysinimonas soli TaxID=1074233 RepID=A0ABW0NUS1_9MICO